MRGNAKFVSFSDMAAHPGHLTLHLVHSEFITISRNWDAADVRSTFWRFYINNRDSAWISWKGGAHRLTSGHLHMIPAYVSFSCHNTGPLRHLYVHFDVLGLLPSIQESVFDRPFTAPLSAVARRLWTLNSSGCDSSGQRECATQAALFDALSRYIASLAPERRKRLDESSGTNAVAPAIRLLEARLPGSIRVGELADAAAMSADHFGRVFRSTVGQTPARYILERRIALAARELLYGDARIDAVAQKHGFANRFHFSRAFLKVMGTTPAEYRRTNRV